MLNDLPINYMIVQFGQPGFKRMSIKCARAADSAQSAFHLTLARPFVAHIIMGRHIASIADSVCTGISNGAAG